MKLILIFIVTFYCLCHHVSGNQQSNQDDPNRPFWATRGRRSGRIAAKADDDIPEKWAEDYGVSEVLEKDGLLRNKQQASALLANILAALYPWEGEIKKRGDAKTTDAQNPFWAARG
ncbi:unnamed protein product [Orchesella dallaii]|uniref:Uncharacterized protein n=1 Tax=Orchesella dallaii TaxID=48710 RepID=A0ABP1QGR1_9HEXA